MVRIGVYVVGWVGWVRWGPISIGIETDGQIDRQIDR